MVACAISIPLVLIAGLRDASIGTDLSVYGSFNFRMVGVYQTFHVYYTYISGINGTEFGYALLNFLTYQFSHDLGVFLGVCSFFTLVPFILGGMNFEKKFKVPLFFQLIFFFTIFYGLSLNEMRQCLAMCWVYYSVSILFERGESAGSILASLLAFIVAFSFHRTAILELVIIVSMFYFKPDQKASISFVKKLILAFASLGAAMFALIILKGGELPSFLSKYSQYLDGSNGLTTRVIGPVRLISLSLFPTVSIFLMTAQLIHSKQDTVPGSSEGKVSHSEVAVINSLMILDLLFMWAGLRGGIFPRLGQYFELFEAVGIFYPIRYWFDRQSRVPIYLLTTIYYFAIFVYITASGYNAIYPYVFSK